ncbi:MAG: VWA domain-containing protein [Pseudomonadales bacterium]|nr:VWA domain-containing protein [Pseudomonadales bacterium]
MATKKTTNVVAGKSSSKDVSAFIESLAKLPVSTKPSARLVFALDATLSRAATWDKASQIQAEMFSETTNLGGLAMQLSYYRGFSEFYCSVFHTNTQSLLREMTQVQCMGGYTQIARIFKQALQTHKQQPLKGVVFIGDACEEDVDKLCNLAGQLGLYKIPVFIFHEGRSAPVERVFRDIARLSGGAYCPFDANSANQLKELLTAVAVFASGGRKALTDLSKTKGESVKLLTQQLK